MSAATIIFRDPQVDHVYVANTEERLTIDSAWVIVKHEDGNGFTHFPALSIKTITVRSA